MLRRQTMSNFCRTEFLQMPTNRTAEKFNLLSVRAFLVTTLTQHLESTAAFNAGLSRGTAGRGHCGQAAPLALGAGAHRAAQSRSSCPGLQLLRNFSSFLPSSVGAGTVKHTNGSFFLLQTVARVSCLAHYPLSTLSSRPSTSSSLQCRTLMFHLQFQILLA